MDSTSILDLLSGTIANKEAVANELLNDASPSMVYGYRSSTSSGLTWGYYGGRVMLAGVMTSVSNGTVLLTASQTNYVEATPGTGVVTANTSGFTAGRIPLYKVVTNASAVQSYEDWRLGQPVLDPRAAITMTADANITLSNAQAACAILDISSTATLTATRNIVLPLVPRQWTVYNGTTGAQSLQFIGASGTGVTVANGKRAIVYSDGTNVVRATPDT